MYQLAVQIAYHQLVVIAACLAVRHSLAEPASKSLGWRPLALAVTATLAGYLAPNAIAFLVVGALLVPIFAGRSTHAIAALTIVGLMVLPPVTVGLKLGSLNLIDITVHDTLAVGAAIWIARQGRRQAVRFDVPFFLFFLVVFLVASGGTTATNKLRILIDQAITWGAPYYVLSRGLRKKGDVQPFVTGLIYAGAIHAALLVFEFFKDWPLYRLMVDRLAPHVTAEIAVKMRGGEIRATASFLEATSAAFALLACTLPAIFAPNLFRDRLRHVLILGLLFAGLLAPQARNALLGLAFGMIVCLLAVRQKSGTIVRFGLASAFLLALLTMISERSLLEVLGLTSESGETVDYRSMLMTEGKKVVAQHPFFGQPMADVVAQLEHLRQGEGIVDFVNTYLWIALGAGLVGLVLALTALLWNFGRLWILARRKTDPVPLLQPFVGLAAAFLVMLAFTSLGGRALTMLLLIFAVGAAWRASRTAARTLLLTPVSGATEPDPGQVSTDPASSAKKLPRNRPIKPRQSD